MATRGRSLLGRLLLGKPSDPAPPEPPRTAPVRFLDVPSRENDDDRGWVTR